MGLDVYGFYYFSFKPAIIFVQYLDTVSIQHMTFLIHVLAYWRRLFAVFFSLVFSLAAALFHQHILHCSFYIEGGILHHTGLSWDHGPWGSLEGFAKW